jgi:2-dehydro-3-deoxyphosphooctonate aldolase (KDO 8-P synthase)
MKSFPESIFIDNPKNLGSRYPFFVMAGPCVIESEKSTIDHADKLKTICADLNIPFIFKSSYDKANRTSVRSFRGPGMNSGLAILKKVKQLVKVPVVSDVHSPDQAAKAKNVLDVIQIPALLCRQTDLLIACAKTNRIVNIKKGQFMAPLDMENAVNKIMSFKNKKIMLTERGTSFGYNNLVSDMRSIPIMKKSGFPVIFDATHSVQLPGAGKDKSLGQRQFAHTLALSAVAAGADALFLEVHESPDKAKCDGPNMISIRDFEKLVKKAKQVWEIINGR